MRALHTAATGMMAQELNVQVISNNIANMRTTGYKRQRAEFQDLLYEHVRRIGSQTSTQGTISPTGADLNVAVRGEGFFKVQMPDGSFTYTRDGSFQMDAQGRIVTSHGNVVQPGITIPNNAQSISISPAGQVSATVPGSSTPTILGQFALTRFVNKAGLQAIGDNLFVETPASGTPQDGVPNTDGYGDVQQGNLEQANVEAVTEISDLIAAQRAYEMNAKVISAADQMLQSTANMFR